MTLTEFLLARIAEVESAALSARGPGTGEWSSWSRSWDASATRDLAADGVRIVALPMTIDEHVCRHDPDRVLRRCAADRQIVEMYRLALAEKKSLDFHQQGLVQGWRENGLSTCQLLASIYVEHRDYQQEWKP